MAYSTVKKEITFTKWKINATTSPTKTYCSLVSLYDLIQGVSLSHDLICFDSNLYPKDSQHIPLTSSAYNLWLNHGIDILPVYHDSRAYEKFIESNYFENGKLGYYEKKGVLYPNELLDEIHNISHNNSSTGGIFTVGDYDYYKGEEYYDSVPWGEIYPWLVTSPLTTTWTNYFNNVGLYVYDEDSTFEEEEKYADNLSPYKKIRLNLYNARVYTALNEILHLTSEHALSIQTSGSSYLLDSHFTDNYSSTIGTSDDTTFGDYAVTVNDATLKDALQKTYVWIRCSFFGDYIVVDNFEQDVTPSSDVKHKNVIVTSEGDYNQYDWKKDDATDSTSETNSENTQTYIPKTTPNLDLLSKSILPSYNKYLTGADKLTLINEIITKGHETDSIVGSVLATPQSRKNDSNISYLTPPGWFEPDSTKPADTYTNIPTLLGRKGNLIIDGRVLSPTVDELWTFLKKVVFGRNADEANSSISDSATPFSSTSEYTNDKDTRVNEKTDFEFKYNGSSEKIGDPIDFNVVTSDDVSTSIITSFINDSEGIKYSLFGSLLTLSNQVTSLADSNVTDTRKIYNFLPWKDNSGTSSDQVLQDTIQQSGYWKQRNNPKSLRELEADNLELKYNLISLARFIKENFTVDGKLGKKSGTTSEIADGSLYQFHKSYNFDIENPNTYFNREGNLEQRAIFSDNATDKDESGNLTYKPTTLVSEYGESSNQEQDWKDYSSEDVYMAADGNWHYIFDNVRIPILESEY